MTVARVLFLVLCFWAGIADAQTYVRPSDGASVTLFNGVDYNGAPVNSSTINLSGFQGLAITVIADANGCTNLPRIQTYASPTGSFNKIKPAPASNSIYVSRAGNATATTFDTYIVAPLFGYVRLALDGVPNDNLVGPGGNCLAYVTTVPIAFSTAQPGAGATTSIQAVGAVTPLIIPSSGNRRNLRLQNVDTAVVYCSSFGASGAQLVNATTQYAIALSAASAANAANGGVAELKEWASNLLCITAAGAGRVAVLTY
jgi:hypothetical protein